jgi:hypothetical protein
LFPIETRREQLEIRGEQAPESIQPVTRATQAQEPSAYELPSHNHAEIRNDAFTHGNRQRRARRHRVPPGEPLFSRSKTPQRLTVICWVNCLVPARLALPQGKLYWACLPQRPSIALAAKYHFFCVDHEFVYWNFFLDFGPLNLGQLYRFCEKLNRLLEDPAMQDRVL